MSIPLHVIFAHPEGGWDHDQRTAAKHLTPGEMYTIRTMQVGRSDSTVTLYETPSDVTFNTTMFDAAARDAEGNPVPRSADTRLAELERALADILSRFPKTVDAHPGRIGQVHVRRWRAILAGEQ
jgi:hypothetical protein